MNFQLLSLAYCCLGMAMSAKPFGAEVPNKKVPNFCKIVSNTTLSCGPEHIGSSCVDEANLVVLS